MGSGKTSVGRALGMRLGIAFFDTDSWVEEQEGRSVPEIFAESGESHFRKREAEALEQACQLDQAIVATGGGLFLAAEHRARIRERGMSIWLDTSLEDIWERCAESGGRPLWGTREELAKLLEIRRECYAAADWRVDTGKRGVAEIVEEAERLIAPGDGRA